MRKPRILHEGAQYHVTARANRKEMILKPDCIKELFQETIIRAMKKYSFILENFCIMENHFHFLIKPGEGESLSRIMQWILSGFAMAYNRKLGITGHVWGERFFSRIVDNLRDFLAVFEYIDKNPVDAGLATNIKDWRYCGATHHRAGLFTVVIKPAIWILSLFPIHHQILLQS
jgi:putative transposase